MKKARSLSPNGRANSTLSDSTGPQKSGARMGDAWIHASSQQTSMEARGGRCGRARARQIHITNARARAGHVTTHGDGWPNEWQRKLASERQTWSAGRCGECRLLPQNQSTKANAAATSSVFFSQGRARGLNPCRIGGGFSALLREILVGGSSALPRLRQ